MILLTLNVSVLLTSQFHEAMQGSLTNIPTWWVLPYWTVNMAHTAHTLCKNNIIGECDVTYSQHDFDCSPEALHVLTIEGLV